MRRCLSVFLALVTFLWVASPVLACVIPGTGMTAQEYECCKQMREMCGAAHMPQSHSCCKSEVQTGSTMIEASDKQSAPALQAVAAFSPFPADSYSSALPKVEGSRTPSASPPDITSLRI